MGGLVIIGQIHRKLAFSTTTPLGANAVYTSPTIDAINYRYINGSWLSDQAGTYVLQHSDDGITFYSGASNNVTANTLASQQNAALLGRYLRLVYTNGATLQTSFHGSFYLAPL
jgi:hypothetical protein